MRTKKWWRVAQVFVVILFSGVISSAVYACWADLRDAASTMQSLFSVTIQANGTAAHLQYALQEGQRDYSYALQAPDFQLKSSYANQVRASDQKVGLLQARMTQVLLSLGDRAPAARFWDDWEAYTESRDMGLARALQGRAPDPTETQAIIARFERLTSDVHAIEEQFHSIAARQAEQVRHSLMLAGVEMACTLCAAAFFFSGLVWNIHGRRKAMRLLLLNNRELECARLFESDRSATMELIGNNELLEQVLLSIINLVEHQLPGAMCSVSILRESYQTGAAPHLPAGYHREILEVVNGGAGMPTSVGDNPQDPVLINDIANDARALPYREITLRHGLRSCWLSPVTSSDGKPLGTVSIYHRFVHVAGTKELAILRKAAQLAAVAAEQRSLFEQLTQQARMDPLTELPNRLLFQDRLQNCLADAASERSQAAVLWIDLDRFKQVNDTLGHRAGDLLLRQAARILTNAAGPGATVARIGGDEFTVLLPGSGRDYACGVAERITSSLKELKAVAEHTVSVSASVGVAIYPDHGDEANTLVRNADAAMYEAKRRGRNMSLCFTEAMAQKSEKRVQIIQHLRTALERNEFELNYQPQSDGCENLVGFEALLRWNSPVLGRVDLCDFIPAAEEAGLIVAIGKWVLQEACRSAANWMRSEARCFTIAVNVSFLQLIRDNFTEEVQDALRESGLPPEFLELELTESFLMQNASESNQQIERLRDLGVRVSIDDFGTGYSSLSYLQHLQVDAVKIDRSFVSEVTNRSSSAVSLIQAIVAMAHELKLKTVGEGVETEYQMEILKSIGCDLMQGYLIQRPMPAGDVVNYLRQGKIQVQAAA